METQLVRKLFGSLDDLTVHGSLCAENQSPFVGSTTRRGKLNIILPSNFCPNQLITQCHLQTDHIFIKHHMFCHCHFSFQCATTIIKKIIFVAYGACWVCLWRDNPLNSDMGCRIFGICTDVNACDCTRGCTNTKRESALFEMPLIGYCFFLS